MSPRSLWWSIDGRNATSAVIDGRNDTFAVTKGRNATSMVSNETKGGKMQKLLW